MRETRSSGSVEGVLSNGHLYSDSGLLRWGQRTLWNLRFRTCQLSWVHSIAEPVPVAGFAFPSRHRAA